VNSAVGTESGAPKQGTARPILALSTVYSKTLLMIVNDPNSAATSTAGFVCDGPIAVPHWLEAVQPNDEPRSAAVTGDKTRTESDSDRYMFPLLLLIKVICTSFLYHVMLLPNDKRQTLLILSKIRAKVYAEMY
jgi:hypothetical protein